MELFTDETIRRLLASSLKTASYDGKAWQDPAESPGSREGDFVDWLTIRRQDEGVLSDVQRIRSHPLVPKDIPNYGYVYQVETGRLVELPASEVPCALLVNAARQRSRVASGHVATPRLPTVATMARRGTCAACAALSAPRAVRDSQRALFRVGGQLQ